MKKLLPIFLALLLLLTACRGDKASTFLLDEDGYGCTDTKTGVHYVALDLAFEPASVTAVKGIYEAKKSDYTRTYYEIPGLDPALYLGDSERGVWCAADTLPDARRLTPTALLVCEEKAESVEIYRFSAGKDDALIAEILTLWFEGEGVDKPEGARDFSRRIKMQSAELANIHYCFEYFTQGENAYFYDLFSGRVVAVPATLAAHFIET